MECLTIWSGVEKQIPVDLVKLSPFGGQTTKSALPAIPTFIVGTPQSIPPAITKSENARLCGPILRIQEVVKQEPK
jgi:hypothetical protein